MRVPYAWGGCVASAASATRRRPRWESRRTETSPLNATMPILLPLAVRCDTKARAADSSAAAAGAPVMLSLASNASTTPKRSPLLPSGSTRTPGTRRPFSRTSTLPPHRGRPPPGRETYPRSGNGRRVTGAICTLGCGAAAADAPPKTSAPTRAANRVGPASSVASVDPVVSACAFAPNRVGGAAE